MVTTLALVFVALVTPTEVAFLEPPAAGDRWSNPLFLTNRFVDLIFIIDGQKIPTIASNTRNASI